MTRNYLVETQRRARARARILVGARQSAFFCACEATRGQKSAADTLIFLLCCSNRNGVPCDSHRHFFEVAIYHGQEDGMAKKATKAKTKPAAKKTPAKKSTAATKRKTTTRKK
jgi:hypothetical protein